MARRPHRAVATFASRVLVAIALSSGVVSAHDVAGARFDAPIPLGLLFVGAGATVGLTALALVAMDAPSIRSDRRARVGHVSERLLRGLRLAGRAGFFLAFVLSIVVGLFGRQVAAENFATAFVWPVWLNGVALVAILVGDPWPALSPWRTMYDGLTRLEGRPIALFEYPERLGRWPALVGFLLFVGIVENLTVIPRSPRATAIWLVGYAMAMLLGQLAFGRIWLDRADAFAVLYRLLGRVAPFRFVGGTGGGYTLVLRPPWRGVSTAASDLATVAFVVAAVYTVSFDGFTNTPEYQTLLYTTRDVSGAGSWVSVGLYLAGFALFLGAYLTVAGATGRLTRRRPMESASSLALTVVPIAAAYEVAHNYPYVIANVTRVLTMASSTVGFDLTLSPLGWLSLPAFWASQVLLIVGGHVVAVVAADVALGRWRPSKPDSWQAHAPLTALMVAYTVVSLWIISRPVVSG